MANSVNNMFDSEYDKDWDDYLSPDEYDEILDRKLYNQSQGNYAWHGITIPSRCASWGTVH